MSNKYETRHTHILLVITLLYFFLPVISIVLLIILDLTSVMLNLTSVWLSLQNEIEGGDQNVTIRRLSCYRLVKYLQEL